MRLVLSGNNKLACDVLDYLACGNDLVGIVAENRDTVLRDEGWEKPFFNYARDFSENRGIPFFEGNVNKYSEEIKVLNPDLISFCRAIGLVKKPILEIPKRGCTNLHYSLLPRYGGCAPIFWAIKNGEPETGVTLHTMTEKFDEGEIIGQERIILSGNERKILVGERQIPLNSLTAFEVYCQANKSALELFVRNYPLLSRFEEKREQMDFSQQSYYKKGMDGLNYEPKMILNLDKPESEIAKEFSSLYFPPFRTLYGEVDGNLEEMRLE